MMFIRDILVYLESENVKVKERAGTYRRDVTNHLVEGRICNSYVRNDVLRYRIPPVLWNDVAWEWIAYGVSIRPGLGAQRIINLPEDHGSAQGISPDLGAR